MSVLKENINNNEYLKAFCDGDERGYDFIFRQYFTALCFFANKILHDEEGAKDIVQDCFLKLWSRRTHLQSDESIKSFLYTIVKNACIDQLRQRKKNDSTLITASYFSPTTDDNRLDEITHAELIREIHSHIQSLPPRMQEVFRKHFFENMSSNEIASELHTDPSTVRQQKARALQLLREKLGASIRAVLFFL